jgi:hypothetical protein
VLRGLAQLLKDGKSIVSLLVRNRRGEVLKAAIKRHDMERATAAFDADPVLASLYGQPVRRFEPDDFRKMVKQSGLESGAVRGVRVISEHLDSETLTGTAYRRQLEFELLVGAQAQVAGIARYIQVIARRFGASRSDRTK